MSNLPQGQRQFRKLAELDSRQASRQSEPAGLRVSQIKGLHGEAYFTYVAQEIRRLTQKLQQRIIYGWKLAGVQRKQHDDLGDKPSQSTKTAYS